MLISFGMLPLLPTHTFTTFHLKPTPSFHSFFLLQSPTSRRANLSLLSHCDACKLLGGGEFTLNQMANEGDLQITKGSTKTYTYTGDSGT